MFNKYVYNGFLKLIEELLMLFKSDILSKLIPAEALIQRYGFNGKPHQWQLGFYAGIDAVVHTLMKQLYPNGVEGDIGRLYRHKESGVEYKLVCIGNELATKPGYIPTVAYVSVLDGSIYMRPKTEFLEKFEKVV